MIFWLRQIVLSLGIAKRGPKLRVNPERQPDIRCDQSAYAAESVRRDADYSVRLPVNLKIATDEIAATAHSFPECVARHNNRQVRVRPAFLCSVKPADHRTHAHEREEILRRQEGEAPPHVVIATDSCDGES